MQKKTNKSKKILSSQFDFDENYWNHAYMNHADYLKNLSVNIALLI